MAAVECLRDAINAHDLEAMVGCFAPDYRGGTPITPDDDVAGKEHVRRNWAWMSTKVLDITVAILRAITEGTPSGRRSNRRGPNPNGRPHHARDVVVAAVVDGLMVHNHLST